VVTDSSIYRHVLAERAATLPTEGFPTVAITSEVVTGEGYEVQGYAYSSASRSAARLLAQVLPLHLQSHLPSLTASRWFTTERQGLNAAE
jgi:hypothetical protein